MDIPEDVMKAANEAAADWFKAIGKSEYHFADAIARAILAERERAARVCEHQAHAFLSPEYAGDQPLGSFFACASCADAIRALSPSLKEEGN